MFYYRCQIPHTLYIAFAQVARFEREASLPPLLETAFESLDAGDGDAPARPQSPAERLVADFMREGMSASGSFLVAQRDAEMMRTQPEKYFAAAMVGASVRDGSANALDRLRLLQDPHGYVAAAAVAAILKEAVARRLRSMGFAPPADAALGLEEGDEEVDEEVASLTGPELALARRLTEGAIRQGVRAASPSATAQAAVAHILRSGVRSSEHRIRAASPAGVAEDAVADIIRKGLGSSERKLRGMGAVDETGDFVSLLGDGEGLGSLNEGSFVSFDPAVFDALERDRAQSAPASRTAFDDAWSEEVGAALQTAHDAHRRCEYAQSEVRRHWPAWMRRRPLASRRANPPSVQPPLCHRAGRAHVRVAEAPRSHRRAWRRQPRRQRRQQPPRGLPRHRGLRQELCGAGPPQSALRHRAGAIYAPYLCLFPLSMPPYSPFITHLYDRSPPPCRCGRGRMERALPSSSLLSAASFAHLHHITPFKEVHHTRFLPIPCNAPLSTCLHLARRWPWGGRSWPWRASRRRGGCSPWRGLCAPRCSLTSPPPWPRCARGSDSAPCTR